MTKGMPVYGSITYRSYYADVIWTANTVWVVRFASDWQLHPPFFFRPSTLFTRFQLTRDSATPVLPFRPQCVCISTGAAATPSENGDSTPKCAVKRHPVSSKSRESEKIFQSNNSLLQPISPLFNGPCSAMASEISYRWFANDSIL